MSLPISSLTTIAKTSISTTHYLPLADGTAANYKLLIQDLFPSFNTAGSGSEALYTVITNKNTLNFKGIKSLDSLLTVATTSNNITLQVNPGNINLDDCDNSVSQFLTGPINLAAGGGGVTGILPAANGGTGLTTLLTNSLFVGNGTTLAALGVATNGQIPIGRTGLSPVLAAITAGTNVTVTNGSGSITIAASLSVLTSALNGAGNNIYGLGWLSGDGQNEGIAINSAGRVFIGSSTPAAFFNYDLNVNNGIGLNGSVGQIIEMSPSATPANMAIFGSNATVANIAGGYVSITAGTASGTGQGGYVGLYGGAASGSGAGGAALIYGGTSSSGAGGNVQIVAGSPTSGGTGGSTTLSAGNSTTGIGGNLTINAGNGGGANVAGSIGITAGTTATGGGGNITISPGGSSTVPGKVTQVASSNTAPFTNFSGTSGAASANSISSSTASASAKFGAIRIQINGVDKWIRVYDTAE